MASGMLDKSKRGTLLASAGKFAAAGLVLGAGALGFKWIANKKREEALRATVEELRRALELEREGVKARLDESKERQRALGAQMEALRAEAEQNAESVEATRRRIREEYEKGLRDLESRVDEIALDAEARIQRASTALADATSAGDRRVGALDRKIGDVESRVDAIERSGAEPGGRSVEDAAYIAVGRRIEELVEMQRDLGRRADAQESSHEEQQAAVAALSRSIEGLAGAIGTLDGMVLARHAEADLRVARVKAGHDENVVRVERTLETIQHTLAELQKKHAENALLESRLAIALRALDREGASVAFGARAPLALTLARALSAVRALERPNVARKIADVLLARGELEGHQTAPPPGERRTSDLYTT